MSWIDIKQAYKPNITVKGVALQIEREALCIVIRFGVWYYPVSDLMNPFMTAFTWGVLESLVWDWHIVLKKIKMFLKPNVKNKVHLFPIVLQLCPPSRMPVALLSLVPHARWSNSTERSAPSACLGALLQAFRCQHSHISPGSQDSVAVECRLWSRPARIINWICSLIAVWPWTTSLTLLFISFLT